MLMSSVLHDNLFDDFFEFPFYDDRAKRTAEKKLYDQSTSTLMKTDIIEMKNGYDLEIDLPGYKKEEIKAELKKGYLTISASKGMDQEEKDRETGRYIRHERYTGACQRSFYVGEEITEKDIKAEFKHGILKLFVPKIDVKQRINEKKCISIEG
ncbi:MAG: Hsp20/alpha crystallin family protein [Fusicatenibacter sp.]|nr:Hsp20/alpha crystallin family protein [Lachnospiraceae bacterium]MDY2938563.1 Hsp20/alpha crystallin family protein [Fusicatenibacter sp.]